MSGPMLPMLNCPRSGKPMPDVDPALVRPEWKAPRPYYVCSCPLHGKEAAAAAGALCCVGLTIVAAGNGGLMVALNFGFWVCVLGLAFAHVPLSQLRLFLPLVPLFYFTFYFNRELVEVWDKILNSDTSRYLSEAATLRIQARHMGFPVISFPYATVNRFGSAMFQLSNVGREFLYLQIALAGAVASTLLYATIRQYERSPLPWPRIRAALVAYGFGLSFAVWSLSSVIDTVMFSTMLLLVFLLHLRHFVLTRSSVACVTVALITALAILISLENVYFVVLFGLALVPRFVRGPTPRIIRHASLYVAVVIATFGCLLQITAVTAGPGFYRTSGDEEFSSPSTDLAENLYRFSRRYVDLEATRSVLPAIGVAYKTWVMSVTAHQDALVENYVIPARRLTKGNVVYFSLILPLVLLSAHGLLRRHPKDIHFIVITVVGLLTIRYVFMLFYARNQNALFATPSIAGFWLLIGLGLSQHGAAVDGRTDKLVVLLLLTMSIFLLLNNGYYLLHIT
jgi:hypothetical protein